MLNSNMFYWTRKMGTGKKLGDVGNQEEWAN